LLVAQRPREGSSATENEVTQRREYMKRTISLAVAWAMVAAASAVAAQSATQKPAQQMTYTGCVAPGKMAGTFMLTNVMAGDGMAKEKPAASAAEKKEMPPKELTLSSTTVKIEPHRGHKVTVMGPTMMEKKEKMMMETKMMVSSLKMVSATCP
jgi:hypothetical protein